MEDPFAFAECEEMMEIPEDISGLDADDISREVLKVHGKIGQIERILEEHWVEPVVDQHVAKSSEEISKMSEPDLLQEISTAQSILLYYEDLIGNVDLEKRRQRKEDILQSKRELKRIHMESALVQEDQKLYCVCMQPHSSIRPMIQCDNCDDWLHLTCVNVSMDQVDQLQEFICPSCSGMPSSFHVSQKYVSEPQDHPLARFGLCSSDPKDVDSLISKMNEEQLKHEIRKVWKDTMRIRKKLAVLAPEEFALSPVQVIQNEDGKLKIRIPRHHLPIEILTQLKSNAGVEYATTSQDFCSICRRAGGLVICCDGCPEVFHPECLNPPIFDPALLPDPWYCQTCTNKISSRG